MTGPGAGAVTYIPEVGSASGPSLPFPMPSVAGPIPSYVPSPTAVTFPSSPASASNIIGQAINGGEMVLSGLAQAGAGALAQLGAGFAQGIGIVFGGK